MTKTRTTSLIESASAKYRRIKAASLQSQIDALPETELFDFTSHSGMEWKLRKIDLKEFVKAGVLPANLVAKMAGNIRTDATDEEKTAAFLQLSDAEQVRIIEFTSSAVRFVAVDPKIVETPINDNEIGFDEITQGDYNDLASWAMQGGVEATGLVTFRHKQKRNARNRAANA